MQSISECLKQIKPGELVKPLRYLEVFYLLNGLKKNGNCLMSFWLVSPTSSTIPSDSIKSALWILIRWDWIPIK